MSIPEIRILGIDTSLRSTGVGVVAATGSRMSAIEYGTIPIAAKVSLSESLTRLHRAIVEIIERTRPEAAAIEGIFFCKNVNTAVVLGEARGVVIAACAAQGLAV